MLPWITVLLCCQLIGEVAVRLAGLPIPGPVAGMLVLLALLVIRGGVPEVLDRVAGGLLRHLALLFVPAGVGVVAYVPLLEAEAVPIAAALVVGTLITIAVTGLVMKLLDRGAAP